LSFWDEVHYTSIFPEGDIREHHLVFFIRFVEGLILLLSVAAESPVLDNKKESWWPF
jgi:hypothetical protein